jgi:hypothetical protein
VGSGYFPDGVAVRAVDVDGDGDVDVTGVNQDGDDVFIWKNGARGATWTKFTMEQSLDSTWDLDIADIDGDGKLDIAVAAGGTADSLVWYPNLGDQFSQVYYDSAPAIVEQTSQEEILAVLVGHNGRGGRDSEIEITELTIEFLRADGVTPLTTSEINSMFVRLHLYQDLDNNGYFDLPGDTSAASLETITLSGGTLTWDLTATGSTVQRMVWPDGAEFFFVVVQAADPSPPVPDKFIARIPAGGLRAQDATFDILVSSESSTANETDIVAIGAEIFADGFESGSPSSWSSSSGG